MSEDNRSPLEKTFNLPASEDELLKELEEKYSFSSNPDLNEVAKLALTAYKEQMLDIMALEPKYRSRALEVANQYLNLAKDAMAKDEDIQLKKRKEARENKEEGDEELSEEGNGATVDRNEFMLRLIEKNKKQANETK